MFPQVFKYEEPYNREAQGSIFGVNYFNGKPIDPLIPPVYILAPSAKKTDWLSVAFHVPYLCLISNRLLTFFKHFRLPPHQIFTAKISWKKELIEDYSLVFFYTIDDRYLDYQKSTFCIARFSHKLQEVEINSYEELLKEREKYPSKQVIEEVRVEKMVIQQDIPFDIIRMQFSAIGLYISENLKTAIEKEGFTGMDFIPLEKLRIGGQF